MKFIFVRIKILICPQDAVTEYARAVETLFSSLLFSLIGGNLLTG